MALDKASALGRIDAYFDGWNAHDCSAIRRTFASTGTYADPTTEAPVAIADIGRVVEPRWAAFPDVRVERSSTIGDGQHVVTEWVMCGREE